MKQQIGNFVVELGNDLLLIKDLKGNVLKGEAVKPFESEDKLALTTSTLYWSLSGDLNCRLGYELVHLQPEIFNLFHQKYF